MIIRTHYDLELKRSDNNRLYRQLEEIEAISYGAYCEDADRLEAISDFLDSNKDSFIDAINDLVNSFQTESDSEEISDSLEDAQKGYDAISIATNKTPFAVPFFRIEYYTFDIIEDGEIIESYSPTFGEADLLKFFS